MENHIQHELEFKKILDFTEEKSLTAYSKPFFSSVHFFTNLNTIQKLLNEVEEMLDCISFDDHPPLKEMGSIFPLLERIQPEEAFLEAEDLLEIKRQIDVLSETFYFFDKRKEKQPSIRNYTEGLQNFRTLSQEIKSKISENGEIFDNASPGLKEVRKLIRELERQLKTQLKRLVKKYQEFTRDDIITLRDGRLVLGIQDSFYHKVPGIVHGSSGTGQTVYVEPLESLQVSNELQNLKLRERKEIIKILKDLSFAIKSQTAELKESLERLGYIDFILAKAKLARQLKATRPILNTRAYYSLSNARHPLLTIKQGYDKVVPLQFLMGDEANIIIITGPNAGGKTVALKTIGLVQLFAQTGFFIPCEEGSELPVVQGIFTDIGDHQSIDEDLSTFSSHIVNLKHIVDQAQPESLFLFDELGAATDPEEGAALAMSVIDWMVDHRMYGVITTHLGQIKAYAADKTGVENASMEFDMDTLKPTYRLRIGIPGASYALHIAAEYGLSQQLIKKAKNFLGNERHSIDNLLIQLNKMIQDYNDRLNSVSKRESEVGALKKLYEQHAEAVREEKRKIKRELLEEMNEYFRQVRLEMTNTIKELKKQQYASPQIQEARNKIKQEQEKLDRQLEELNEPMEELNPNPGDWVELKDLGRKAIVVSEPNEKGRLWIDVDGLKMQVRINQITSAEPPPQAPSHVSPISGGGEFMETSVKPELDLRGMDVSQAIDETDNYLYHAMNAGWDEVRIIHGKGKGILRTEINKYLGKDKRVLEKRFGNYGEGDLGVTVVKLRKEKFA